MSRKTNRELREQLLLRSARLDPRQTSLFGLSHEKEIRREDTDSPNKEFDGVPEPEYHLCVGEEGDAK